MSFDSFLLLFLLFVIIVGTAGRYEDIKLRDYQNIVRLSRFYLAARLSTGQLLMGSSSLFRLLTQISISRSDIFFLATRS